jgi:hypothetical protein
VVSAIKHCEWIFAGKLGAKMLPQTYACFGGEYSVCVNAQSYNTLFCNSLCYVNCMNMYTKTFSKAMSYLEHKHIHTTFLCIAVLCATIHKITL